MDSIRYHVELMLKASSSPGSELTGEATYIFSGKTHHFSSIMELADLIEEEAHRSCPHLQHKLRNWKRAQPTISRGQQSEPKGQDLNRQTFHVSVQFAENYTWQGTIRWLEGRRSLHFRSFLEMMRLMDEATRTAASEVSAATNR
jgi:hypothetical protein